MEESKIVEYLKKGRIVILPTDTVYGIVADAFNLDAVDKVFKAKNRSYEKPFLILISNMDMLKKVVKKINPKEQELIKKYWPGPLTILFEKSENISDLVTSGSKYVAVRFPKNEFLCNIINNLGNPIVAPSANISGKPSAHKIADLEEKFKDKADLIYDGGELFGTESTLVKVENNNIMVIRKGKIRII